MNHIVLTIVSDDDLRETILAHLEAAGLVALGAASMGEGMVLAGRAGPAIILLEQSLVAGEAVLCDDQLRGTGAPLVVLLATGGSGDAVAALEAGADDFISHPRSIAVLTARVMSLLRRRRAPGGQPAVEIRIGDLVIDRSRRGVTLGGQPIKLAPKEFAILLALAERADRVVTREELVGLVWSARRAVKRQTLDVYFFSLRSKIEADPDRPARLLTVRGIGYRLIAPPTADGADPCPCVA
jgi:DNA-binding response OmpR family regulator